MDFMVVVVLNWQTWLIPVRPHSKLVQLSEKWVYDWNWLLLTCAFLYGLAENRKLHLTSVVHLAKRMRSRKHTLYCIIQSYHILFHHTANMHVSTSILISFPFLLPDDNEFEDVNIVQPNDFYQSRDADNGNWWNHDWMWKRLKLKDRKQIQQCRHIELMIFSLLAIFVTWNNFNKQ